MRRTLLRVHRRRAILLGLVMTLLGAFLVPVAVGASGTLDQSNPVVFNRSWEPIIGTEQIAQTFTSGITGTLDQVDLYLWALAGQTTPAPLTVQIQTISSDGSPSGN